MKFCIFDKVKNRFEVIRQDDEQQSNPDKDRFSSAPSQSQQIQSLQAIPALTWDSSSTPIKLSMTLQQPYAGMTPVDQSLLWTIIAPPSPLSRRPSFIVFRQGQIVVQNWITTMPPTCIYLGVDNVTGYKDQYGNQTNRLARYVITGMIQSGTITAPIFSVTYELKDSPAWQLPPSLSQINLRVYFDDGQTPVQLPLPFQVGISLQFRKFVQSSTNNIVNSQNEEILE